jgi:hypothetical protein
LEGRVTDALVNGEIGFAVAQLDEDSDDDAQFVVPFLIGTPTMYLKSDFFDGGVFTMPALEQRGIPQLGTIFNELWHAYSKGVVDEGGDPDLQAGVDRARSWIQDEATTRTGPVATDDVEGFTDEYLSSLTDQMARVHFQLKLSVDRGQLSADTARDRWGDFLDGGNAAGTDTTKIVGYEQRTRVGGFFESLGILSDTTQTVTNSPPRNVVDPIADAFGFGGF